MYQNKLKMSNLDQFIQSLLTDETETQIQEIQHYANNLIEKHGDNADLVFSDNIQKFKAFHQLLNKFYETKFQQTFKDREQKFEEKIKTSANNQTPKSRSNNLTVIEPSKEEVVLREYGDTNFAAQIVPYPARAIREMANKNEIPHSRPRGKYLFCRTELLEWLKTNGEKHRHELLKIGKHSKP